MAENSPFRAFVVPGGRMMEAKTDQAVGYDTYLRAIVHPDEKDPNNPNLRRTLYDFSRRMPDPTVERYCVKKDMGSGKDEWVYCLHPGKWAHCAIGVVLEMEFPWYGDLRPRSGLASKGITIANTPGTIDPDYRGEACAILANISPEPYFLRKNERIAQMLIIRAHLPEWDRVKKYEELSKTFRATGGFGHTGQMG